MGTLFSPIIPHSLANASSFPALQFFSLDSVTILTEADLFYDAEALLNSNGSQSQVFRNILNVMILSFGLDIISCHHNKPWVLSVSAIKLLRDKHQQGTPCGSHGQPEVNALWLLSPTLPFLRSSAIMVDWYWWWVNVIKCLCSRAWFLTFISWKLDGKVFINNSGFVNLKYGLKFTIYVFKF